MEVSQVVLEWQAQALARGLDQGRAEGRAKMLGLLREKLLRLLQVKFQTELPADLIAAVQSQAEPALLGQWFDQSLNASTLDEVRTAFGRP